MDLNLINGSNVLSEDTMLELYSIEDLIEREQTKQALRAIAKKNGKTKDFDDLIKTYSKVIKLNSVERTPQKTTKYSDLPDGFLNLPCGSWIADDSGVRIQSWDGEIIWACKHPIIPVERLKNLQTGFEQIKLAYKRDNYWQSKTFPKDVLSSQSKIVGLSNYGILVNSENARSLVRYFTDVEAGGSQYIAVSKSSSKFGWIEGEFLPYDQTIEFDSENRFAQLSDAVREHGDEIQWMRCIEDIRQNGSFAVRMMMAASFASVLLEKVDALPFFIDLWGDTEGGKTVTLMVCSSIWADPSENKFIGDFKSTDVALEAKANALNNLPMLLDDTSKTSARMRDNFEGFVYDIASGKGKSRSDRDLGIRYENNWRLIVLTTGEAPLSGYVNQGGAINRILEVKADTRLFDDPQGVVECIRNNYGFAGKKFIEAIKAMPEDDLKKTFKQIQREVENVATDAMQKQTISLSVVLLADKIATDSVFKDRIYLDTKEAAKVLVDPSELSGNERAYEFMTGKINMNAARFDPKNDHIEQWGFIEGQKVYIYVPAFGALCEQGRFSKKSFCDWAIKHGVLEPDSRGCPTKAKKINGKVQKVYCFILPDESEEEQTFIDFN